MSDGLEKPKNASASADTYHSWIPRRVRRVLQIGLYGAMGLYVVVFTFSLLKVGWDDYRSCTLGALLMGGIPALMVALAIGWYFWTTMPARRKREPDAGPWWTALVSGSRQFAGLLVFGWVGFLILAMGISTAWTVGETNRTFFALGCVPLCSIPVGIGLLVIGTYALLFVQAGAMNRYVQAANGATVDDAEHLVQIYQQRRATPQKYIVLALLSQLQGDLSAAETYLRDGLARVKRCRFCFLQPTVNAQWFSVGLHEELASLLVQQGRFAEAAESMRAHLPTYVFPNHGLLLSAWYYFLADDKANARAMLERIRPIKFLHGRGNWGIITIQHAELAMSHQTKIVPEFQCLLPFLHVNLYGQFDPAAFELRARHREFWEGVAALESPYGQYVRALLPAMYTVWDLYGIGPTLETATPGDQAR